MKSVLPAIAAVIMAAMLPLAAESTATQGAPETAASASPGKPAIDPARSLVYVTATAQRPRFAQPWEKNPPQRRRGLGAYIGEGRVLVTAELIADSAFIEFERPGDGLRRTARVLFRDYECNLALLETDQGNGFFDTMQPLELDGAARAGDTIQVWQLEDDGSPLISEGRLSRIQIGPYFVPDRQLLRYEFKGSLQNKSGSFIIPAVRDGRLTGILLGYNANDQIADILPAPIIQRFLDDLAEGDYLGFPVLGVTSSHTTDEQFRRWLGLEPSGGGVYINRVRPNSAAEIGGILPGDVILGIDGFEIDRRGFYDDPDFGRLNFGHLVSARKKAGEPVEMTLWRDKEEITLSLVPTRTPPEEFLVDPYMFDRMPRYFVLGGMVFIELSRPFLTSFNDWQKNAPLELLHAEANPEQYNEGRRKLVVLLYSIPTPATLGYERVGTAIVQEVNGKFITDLNDLGTAVAGNTGPHHSITLLGDYPVLHLDAQLAETVNRQLQANGITPLKNLDP